MAGNKALIQLYKVWINWWEVIMKKVLNVKLDLKLRCKINVKVDYNETLIR